ncbi:MAG: DUF6049 family protein, partial [Pseudonocardia sp.]|nr:DUF6049 family protein [Pseudonocardia sp.]
MKRTVAALVATVVLLLAGPLTGAALAGRPQQPVDVDQGLELRLDALDPRIVTATGPTVLTITGVLSNTGDERVDGLGIRLQRGLPLRTEGAVREALEGVAPTDVIVPEFQELGPGGEVDSLDAGAQVPVRLTVPLRGAPESTLALSGPGVYELLINVNGVPEGGDRARLAAVRMLLPVLGLPPGADGSAAVTAAPDTATPFTLLYPVADRPRRLSTVPGAPTLLTDAPLADSFAPAGRLGGLVAALAGAGPAARAATCVAVDPDLLQTAAAMSDGYQVVGADGALVPGRGAATAAGWLEAFRAATRGACVLALPFADADVVALTRHGLAASAVDAVTSGQAIVADLLGTPVLPDTAWPADSVINESALGTLTGSGVQSVVLSADGVDLPSGADPSGVVPLGAASRNIGPSSSAVLAAPLLTLAAGG